jgi:hypothetical protein
MNILDDNNEKESNSTTASITSDSNLLHDKEEVDFDELKGLKLQSMIADCSITSITNSNTDFFNLNGSTIYTEPLLGLDKITLSKQSVDLNDLNKISSITAIATTKIIANPTDQHDNIPTSIIPTTAAKTTRKQRSKDEPLASLSSSFKSQRSSLNVTNTNNGINSETVSLTIGKRLAMLQEPDIQLDFNNISLLNLSINTNNNPQAAASAADSSNNNNSYFNNIILKDPVLIRGAGNITIFGVSNRFSEQFPTQLNAKLAPEEFKDTIKQINLILNKELANSLKWLIFGSIFCCCTLGCSLLPVIFMNKKARLSVNKLLDMENQRLYLKLGLKWRLAKVKCNSNALLEYVLLIEFLPTILLYQPD